MSRRGISLIELIVALLLLELTGVVALTTILTSERLGRHAAAASRDDIGRWESYRTAEVADACANTGVARVVPFTAPATVSRPALDVSLLCGR